MKKNHSKDVNLKFQLVNGQAVLYITVAYILRCKLIMVTITRYVFINIFQTEDFSAVKFAIGYEKYMSFLVIAKSPKG